MARRTVVTLLLAGMVALSGCGALSGPLTFTAEKATVSDSALSETGYEEVNVSKRVIQRNFSVAGQSKQVEVTNWISQYEHRIDLGPLGEQRAAVFAVISTPQVDVLGREFNPVGDYTNRELVELVQRQYEGISNLEAVGVRNTTVLGKETQVTKFSGTATISGQKLDVYLHVTKVEHGGDYVVAVAVYPQRLPGEEDRVFTLLEGIEHEGSESSS